jgi:hypothetical protein
MSFLKKFNTKKKRVNRKIDKEKEIKAKEEREEKKKKGIFEVTLPKIILRNLSFKVFSKIFLIYTYCFL